MTNRISVTGAPHAAALAAYVRALAWPNRDQRPGAAPGTALGAYSVRLGTRLLTEDFVAERAKRYVAFLAAVAPGAPPPADGAAALLAVLRPLWRLNIINEYKEPCWRVVIDGISTSAKMHQPQVCGCGAGGALPGRAHHFGECAVARRVLAKIDARLPTPLGAALPTAIWTAAPPPGVNADAWRVVVLAAAHAMNAGRRYLRHKAYYSKRKEPRGPPLAAAASDHAAACFLATTLGAAALAADPALGAGEAALG